MKKRLLSISTSLMFALLLTSCNAHSGLRFSADEVDLEEEEASIREARDLTDNAEKLLGKKKAEEAFKIMQEVFEKTKPLQKKAKDLHEEGEELKAKRKTAEARRKFEHSYKLAEKLKKILERLVELDKKRTEEDED